MKCKDVGAFALVLAWITSIVFILVGCSESNMTPTIEEVSIGDCTVQFEGARWDEGGEWGLMGDNMVFVLFGTVTNSGDSAVRPSEHLMGSVLFEGSSREETLKARMPSGNVEVAAGESAEVEIYAIVDTGIKKGYYDGHNATVQWGWSDDLTGVNLDIASQAYEAFKGLENVYTISLGRV